MGFIQERVASQILHKVALSFVKQFSPKTLQNLIYKEPRDLFLGYARQTNLQKLGTRVLKIIAPHMGYKTNYLNIHSLMKEVYDHRPDLFPILCTPAGVIWTQKIIHLAEEIFNGTQT